MWRLPNTRLRLSAKYHVCIWFACNNCHLKSQRKRTFDLGVFNFTTGTNNKSCNLNFDKTSFDTVKVPHSSWCSIIMHWKISISVHHSPKQYVWTGLLQKYFYIVRKGTRKCSKCRKITASKDKVSARVEDRSGCLKLQKHATMWSLSWQWSSLNSYGYVWGSPHPIIMSFMYL